ncbi:MAG: hypothetical protein QM647_04635 [Asticcacaulis sp.]|uniref:HD domain-containing protein n=1 Tax=Asticcacaulis sp. TaxID=1872648 RepID=UPI0039E4051D
MAVADVFAAEWRRLAESLNLSEEVATTVLSTLQAGYNEPGRHYHTQRHIVSMLEAAQPIGFQMPKAAHLATFFHDLVYEPVRSDNETRSAARMTEALTGYVDAKCLEKASEIILATAHHRATGDQDTDLVLDLDMAILGQPWPVYETYARNVMAEYAPFFSREAWCQGRNALFIEPTLAREAIFLTETFRPLETQTRENLRREQAWLTTGGL